ncbi:AMP-binding protein [Nocardiopsis sp. EMB25]|uniref:(2,3-dihydroxybenzoyl)adenylate synthase n=1 Tax=Nocardiopsis sp. EMB25 TaxID=2835867 RepID=UPI0022848658|nr:AMP-binding protein [Nocardiopsis sp. EMB25]MCY9782675.1 AMP-binding protein [Nocardiopsis sp. EMB25]
MPNPGVVPPVDGFVPWPTEAAAVYRARGYWEGRPLGSRIAEAARARPDAVCLVDGDVRMTFRELMARADGAALRMRGLGVRAADRVVVQLPNRWEHVVMTVACLRLGAPPVWVLPQYRLRELTEVVAHTGPRMIVVPDAFRGFDHQGAAHEAARAVEGVEHVVVGGASAPLPGGLDLAELCAPAPDPERARASMDRSAPDPGSVAVLKLSGGTTGLPKVVARTHDDLSYMITRAGSLCGFGPDTAYLAVLPLAHGFPNTGPGVLGALAAGGRVVVAPSPTPETVFPLIERERVTATSAVPAIVSRWLEYRESGPAADLDSLRLLQVGASRLAPATARRIRPELGCALQQVFGMSEGLLCLTRLDDPDDVVHHTQGRPICPDDETMVVDPRGKPVETGVPGALLTRGPYTVRGYYRSPELDARHFTGDGWYRTGDIVRLCPDGNLVVVGREKDVINRGGEKVSAEEVEDLALRAAGVRRAAAVAFPDDELGERICLFVVPSPGHRVVLEDVRRAMAEAGTASFKLPERLLTVDSLPVTALGKTDKSALRSRAAAPPA